jgi:transcriptional regulator with XRE-family HTH domain
MPLKINRQEVADTARRIRNSIDKQGMKVHQVAEKTGITLSALQRICDGAVDNPGIWTMQAIADCIEVPLSVLMGREDGT